MGIKCLQTVFKIRDPVLSDTLIPGKSDTLSLLEMGKLTHCECFVCFVACSLR